MLLRSSKSFWVMRTIIEAPISDVEDASCPSELGLALCSGWVKDMHLGLQVVYDITDLDSLNIVK